MALPPDTLKTRFSSQKDKSLTTALAHRIGREFPRIGGPRIRELCAKMILEVLAEHQRPREHVSHGQVLWIAVDRDSPPRRHQRLVDTPLVPVLLDLSLPEDVDRRIARVNAETRLAEKAQRLCRQAYEQGGLLSNCDLAELLSTSDARIAELLTDYEEQHQTIVPRRANLHDVGSGVTHKRIICWKRYAEGKEAELVARETYHSLEAVDRYLGQYARVRHCRLEGLTTTQTAEVLGCSERLVLEYCQIDRLLQDHRSSKSTAEQTPTSGGSMESIPWLDFAAIRSQVTMEQLLRYAGHWQRMRRSSEKQDQYRGPCPFHDAGDSKRRARPFSVSTSRNIFNCFEEACGASGNVLDFWRLWRNLPFREAAWDLVQTFGLSQAEGPQGPLPENPQNNDP